MIIIEVIYFMESLYDGHPTICTFGRHKEFMSEARAEHGGCTCKAYSVEVLK